MGFLVLEFVVVLGFVSAAVEAQSMFLLEHHFTEYDVSAGAQNMAALSEDMNSVFLYDVMNRRLVSQVKLDLPGQLIKWSPDGEMVAVAHDSYITLLDPRTEETNVISVPVQQASSIAIVQNVSFDLICILPAFDQWTSIFCIDSVNKTVKTCSQMEIYAGSLIFASPVVGWVYMLDQELEPPSIYKLVTIDECLQQQDSRSAPNQYTFGSHVWYSYDKSRIFLDNGVTLTSSDDPNTDMQTHGDINSTFEISYSWIEQTDIYPYHIAATNFKGELELFSWPYLQPVSSQLIPTPSNATAHDCQVHYAANGAVIATFCTYQIGAEKKLETGIAYIPVVN